MPFVLNLGRLVAFCQRSCVAVDLKRNGKGALGIGLENQNQNEKKSNLSIHNEVFFLLFFSNV